MKYIFGSHSRAIPYIKDENYKKLTIFNLWKLNRNDYLFVTRAWSPIVYMLLKLNKRPIILQLADGLVTESNCKKNMNSRPHYLYENVYADRLIVRQPIDTLPDFIDVSNVSSIIDHEDIMVDIECSSIVFVFGNDPFVCHTKEQIHIEIDSLLKRVDDSTPIYFSSPSLELTKFIKNRYRGFKDVGRCADQAARFKDSLIVITPSTVGYDFSLKGYAVVSLGDCGCSTMNKLFSSSSSVYCSNDGESIVATVFKYVKFQFFPLNLKLTRRLNLVNYQFRSDPIIFLKRFIGDVVCLLKSGF